jgi:hypothetical protein
MLRRKWEYKVKWTLRKLDKVLDWIHFAQDRVHYGGLTETVMDLHFP